MAFYTEAVQPCHVPEDFSVQSVPSNIELLYPGRCGAGLPYPGPYRAGLPYPGHCGVLVSYPGNCGAALPYSGRYDAVLPYPGAADVGYLAAVETHLDCHVSADLKPPKLLPLGGVLGRTWRPVPVPAEQTFLAPDVELPLLALAADFGLTCLA